MRPADVVRRAAGYLERHDVQSPQQNAERLLMAVLGVDRGGLYARDDPLGPGDARAFGRLLCRRCAGTPLQHLTGEEGFRRLVLRARPGVFVPRPETEILVEEALERIRGLAAPLVADACTGTGAVALAIADEHPGARVLATDLSPDAVALAQENAEALGLPVEVLQSDLLDRLPEDLRGAFDLVTCNPPYVPEERRDELPPEVLADPELAVFGGPPIYERLFAHAMVWLRPGGHAVVEIEETQGAAVRALAREAGFTGAQLRQDLNGRDRVVTARRP